MSASQAVTILSAKTRAKPKGTSIQGKDAEEIVAGVQAMYEKIPAFIRPMLPALPDILRRIPASAGKYSLNEIIELLDSRSEEHTSELQSPCNLVRRLLLEKKKKNKRYLQN